MSHRRTFIRTMAGAAAGMFAIGRGCWMSAHRAGPRAGTTTGGEPPTGPVQRRIVQVGGRRVRVVDVHAHVTVPEVEPLLVGTEFANEGGGRAMGPERIWEMDRRGIDVQAISVNGYWWYGERSRPGRQDCPCARHRDSGVVQSSLGSLRRPDFALDAVS